VKDVAPHVHPSQATGLTPRRREIGCAFRLKLVPHVGQSLLDAAVQVVQLLKNVVMTKFQVFQQALGRRHCGGAFRCNHLRCFLGTTPDQYPIGSASEADSNSLARAATNAEMAKFAVFQPANDEPEWRKE